MTQIIPIGDRILVKPKPAPTMSPGGIHLPGTDDKAPGVEAVVVATGTGKKSPEGVFEQPICKVGDTVLYQKYTGTEVQIAGERHVILNGDDVLAIVGKK